VRIIYAGMVCSITRRLGKIYLLHYFHAVPSDGFTGASVVVQLMLKLRFEGTSMDCA